MLFPAMCPTMNNNPYEHKFRWNVPTGQLSEGHAHRNH